MAKPSLDQKSVVHLLTKFRKIENSGVSSLEINDIDLALNITPKYFDDITEISCLHLSVAVVGIRHLVVKFLNLKSLRLF